MSLRKMLTLVSVLVAGFLVKGGEVLASSQDNGRAIDMGEKNTGEGDRTPPVTREFEMWVHLNRLFEGEKLDHGINDYMVKKALAIMKLLYMTNIQDLDKEQFLYWGQIFDKLIHLGFKVVNRLHLEAMDKLLNGYQDNLSVNRRCARLLDEISKDDVDVMMLLYRNPGNCFFGIARYQPSDVVIQATKYLLNIDDQELRTTFGTGEIIAYVELCCDIEGVKKKIPSLKEPTAEEIRVVADLSNRLFSQKLTEEQLQEQMDLLREVIWRIRTFREIPNALARHTSPYDARNDIFSDHDEMQIVWIRPGAVILKNTGDIFRVNDKFVVKRGAKSHLKSCWKSGKISEIWITDEGLYVFNDTHGFRKPKGTGDDCQCPYQQIIGKTVTFNALRSAGDEAYIFEGLKEFRE